MKGFRIGASLGALFILAVACEQAPSTDTAHATEAGGVLGYAPKIAFGKTVKGTIRDGQIDVWAIDLKGGDKLKLVEKVVKGDLAPDAALFLGASQKIKSASHQAAPKTLTKTYAVKSTGRYYVVVSAYKGKGAGDYSLKVTCTGGPCNGEPVVVELDDVQANDCLGRARPCALAAATADGSVTVTEARAMLKSCLGKTTLEDEGLSCKTACDRPEHNEVCEGFVKLLPFYASKPAACLAELNDCVEACQEGDGPTDAATLFDMPEYVCLQGGFNGNCDSYARGHEDCGGNEYADDTSAECHAFCESTFGAWNDDLDTICVENCPE
jgi:hypothetical protein